MSESINRIFKKIFRTVLVGLLMVMMSSHMTAQENNSIQWLTFEQLDDSLSIKPKKIFIDFYAHWCDYCKKMDRVAFRDAAIISKLNNQFYAVKMDAEYKDSIYFGNQVYINQEVGKKRNPTHQIALILASRENEPFSLPAIVILNERFEVERRFFEYLSPKKLIRILNEN